VVVVEQNVERAISNSDWVYVLVAGRNRVEGTADHMRSLDLPSIFLGKSEKGEIPADPSSAAQA
jgi:ABC-type branched-subunit amino acid transport system ATPase component